jgi:hypothetical protein
MNKVFHKQISHFIYNRITQYPPPKQWNATYNQPTNYQCGRPAALASTLVTTWAKIPMGQKSRHSETECLVSMLFLMPSWYTCLHCEWKRQLSASSVALTSSIAQMKIGLSCAQPCSEQVDGEKVDPGRGDGRLACEHPDDARQLHKMQSIQTVCYCSQCCCCSLQ